MHIVHTCTWHEGAVEEYHTSKSLGISNNVGVERRPVTRN